MHNKLILEHSLAFWQIENRICSIKQLKGMTTVRLIALYRTIKLLSICSTLHQCRVASLPNNKFI